MICSRCSHRNNEDEHRCTKCATRLSDHQVESAFHSYGALALQPMAQESAVAVLEAPEGLTLESNRESEAGSGRIPRYVTSLQQSLFALREGGKVVSIDGMEPDRRPAKPK